MAKIKSTLDLVMEKTRHLTLSDEERREQEQRELKQKLKGLVQKYLDGRLKSQQLEREANRLKNTHGSKLDHLLLLELLNRLKLDQVNDQLLLMLKDFCGIDVGGFEKLFDNYKNKILSKTKKRSSKIKKGLAKKRLVSGTAVVPNLEADDKWVGAIIEIRAKFDRILEKEKSRFM